MNPSEIRILVVDHDAGILSGTVSLLGQAGYAVDSASSGEDALRAAREHQPDLVLLDRDFPDLDGLDGLETCRRMKNTLARADVFVVIVSALRIDSEQQAEGLESGADDYITRPIGNRELLARVAAFSRIIHMARSLNQQAQELKETNELASQTGNASLNVMEDALEARDRAEQSRLALLESHERFELANRATFNVIWDWDIKTNAIWRNDNFEELFGYSRDEVGAGFVSSNNLIHPEDAESVRAGIKVALDNAGSEFWADQYRFRRKDGSYATVEDRGIITRNAKGQALRMLGAMQDISERKLAEQALRESEEKQRMIIEHSVQLFYSHTPDNLMTYVSSQVGEFFDAGPDDTYRPWTDFLTDNPVNALGLEISRQALETGERQRPYELELLTPRGRIIWVEVHESPVVDHGHVIAMVGALTDITESKRTHDQLRLQGGALEAAANAITITDQKGVIQWVNPAFSALTGYSASEAIGRRPGDLIKSGKQDPGFYSRMWTTLLDGKIWRGEIINRRKDGSLYTGEKTITPLKDDRGEITHFTSVEQDVSERKQAEASLRLQGGALEAAANAMVITDLKGRIEWANAAFTTFTGYSLDEAIGKQPSELVKSGKHDLAFYKTMWDTLLAGEVWQGEIINKRKDGSLYTEDMTITPLRDESGGITHFIAVKQDITQRKQAERELSDLNRSLTMLSACNEALVRANNEQELLDVICRIAVQIGGYHMAWVGYAQDDAARTIVPKAFAGQELGYLSEIQVTWSEDQPSGMGPAGRAIRSGQTSLFTDITLDPASFRWLEAAQQRGYRGVVSLPLSNENRTFGVLNLYGNEPLHLAEKDIELLKEMADDLAFGIGNIRAQLERKQLASLLDKAQDAILVRDLNHRILFWNKGAERLYGWKAEEMIGHIPLDEVYDDLKVFDEAQNLVMLEGEWNGRIHQRRKDGNLLTVEGHWTLVKDDQGRPVSVLAINTDITEKVEAERELQQYTDRLEAMREIDVAILGARSTLELVQSALVRLRKIVPFERAAAVLFNESLTEGTVLAVDQDIPWEPLPGEIRPIGDFHDMKELLAAPFMDIPDLSEVQGCIMEELILSQGLRNLVYIPMESEGTVLGFLALSATTPGILTPKHAEIALDMNDQLVVAIQHTRLKENLERSNLELESKVEERTATLTTTVATMKVLENELLKREADARGASEAKSTFLASMSHELRTPLIGVTGMLEILGQTQLDAEQRQIAAVIRESSQSLLQIIGDILDFSKIEANKLELSPHTFSVRDLVESISQIFQSAVSAKGLDLITQVDPELAAAHWADALRIRQILNNFLSNAVKFTERGSINLRVRLLKSQAGHESMAFEVQDSGIGVSDENQAKLFEPFTQAETSTTRRFGGTGLGLVISRRLAELMGGTLAMKSSLGRGTTITLSVDLPVGNVQDIVRTDVSASSNRVPTRLAPSIEEAIRERSLVLMAEDHPTNRTVLTQQVRRAGYAMEVAEDGQEAFEKWQSGRYAVILTDLHMPRMDGYRLTQAVREWEREHGLERTPILALTANAMGGEAERCIDLGMDDYLIKPVTIPLLASKLHKWMPHVKLDLGPDPDSIKPSESLPALDSRVLMDLCGNDDAAAKEILDDFIATAKADFAMLQDAVQQNDKPSVIRQAHRLKGSSAMIGARYLTDRAGKLEACAKTETAEWETLKQHVAWIQEGLEKLNEVQ
ncbi:MAG: PAS domain S-box protein [Holophagaceae bacterium]|nr:PAS domain S-box protein [Holophagaceae bacterium]